MMGMTNSSFKRFLTDLTRGAAVLDEVSMIRSKEVNLQRLTGTEMRQSGFIRHGLWRGNMLSQTSLCHSNSRCVRAKRMEKQHVYVSPVNQHGRNSGTLLLIVLCKRLCANGFTKEMNRTTSEVTILQLGIAYIY